MKRAMDNLHSLKRHVVLMILATLGVLLVAASVFTVVFERELSDRRAMEAAGAQALEVAKVSVPEVFSYDFNTADRQLEAALRKLAGKFQADFAALSTNVIVPAARRDSIVTTASVVEGAVVSADTSTATLLLFLNQSTVSTKYQGPRLDGSRILVTMTKVDELWLIEDLVPV
ncbi:MULTISPECIES: hypothetical protein [Nocardia]|uniref:hypothetical protein n=1 Tax=Nocardia TaxID=1817 RepID=UPI0007EAB715|nr:MULTISPECIES: hypothetical protein [Nocardia]MBF6278414.1 hypothetical protein [Nocardia nova]OBA50499.1 hypothetical protein A5789_29020 [Nocardia sp. 852002-51101_SCH5132738]OBB33862.1 hypothetical protein A5748_07575 [Nocardia sp. 852002-51244_SCH5132740]OBF69655.1 hypothetical protein A9X06_32290 [Mycobacterium sp. 852002-51759_SCH5129042]